MPDKDGEKRARGGMSTREGRLRSRVVQLLAGHLFYEKLSEVLAGHGFTQFVEEECRHYYVDGVGRPSIPPTVGTRSYVSEPDRGRRSWEGEDKDYARYCVYGNRRRIGGDHGKALLRQP